MDQPYVPAMDLPFSSTIMYIIVFWVVGAMALNFWSNQTGPGSHNDRPDDHFRGFARVSTDKTADGGGNFSGCKG